MAIAEISSGMVNETIPSVSLLSNNTLPTNCHGSPGCSHEMADFNVGTMLFVVAEAAEAAVRGSCLLANDTLSLEFNIVVEADTMAGTIQIETDFGHLEDFLAFN